VKRGRGEGGAGEEEEEGSEGTDPEDIVDA